MGGTKKGIFANTYVSKGRTGICGVNFVRFSILEPKTKLNRSVFAGKKATFSGF